MKDQTDYSQYECPYSHVAKDCGHELHGPEGYEETYGIWCACGYRAPLFTLDPGRLRLHRKTDSRKAIYDSRVEFVTEKDALPYPWTWVATCYEGGISELSTYARFKTHQECKDHIRAFCETNNITQYEVD